jgi:hypothetical protein
MNAPLSIYRIDRRPQLALLFAREETSPYGDASEGSTLEPEAACDWTEVHERIVALRAVRAAHERELCRWLLAAERLGVHARAGYASLREYADRVVGLSRRETEERLRVGRVLAELKALDSALACGELTWSAVRELSRVATGETERAWVDWAKGRRVRQVEQAVASRRQGDSPDDRGDPSLVKHRLSFEVRAETMCMFRDLQAAVRADLGMVDDDTLLYEIARRALGGPGDPGRASYQVAVVRCDECARTSIDAGGVRHEVDEAVAEMMSCDSQTVHMARAPDDSPHVGAGAESAPRRRATQTIPPAIRREVLRRDGGRCVVPGCTNHRFIEVHHIDLKSEGGGHDPERTRHNPARGIMRRASPSGASRHAAHRGHREHGLHFQPRRWDALWDAAERNFRGHGDRSIRRAQEPWVHAQARDGARRRGGARRCAG